MPVLKGKKINSFYLKCLQEVYISSVTVAQIEFMDICLCCGLPAMLIGLQRVPINIVHGEIADYLKKPIRLGGHILHHFKAYGFVYNW